MLNPKIKNKNVKGAEKIEISIKSQKYCDV